MDDFPFQMEGTKDTPLGMPDARAAEKYTRMDYSPEDFYNYFPCFTGAKNLSRYLSLYECYRKTLGIAGHMAEVGVYRGGASLFLAKLSLLHEPHAMTQVHGFDWFREPDADDEPAHVNQTYHEPYNRISELIGVQGLQRYVLLHRLNVVTELQGFFEEHSHLQFKLVFLDSGEYDIVARCIREFWPRMSNGAIMVFDQFNHEVAPGETKALKELLPSDSIIRTFPQGWMPTAYVVKGERVADLRT